MKAIFSGAKSGHRGEPHERAGTYRSNIPVLLVLLASTADSDQEKKNPRDTDFCPHLQVDAGDPRVERSAHPVVVEEVAAHPHRGSSAHSDGVGEPADEEAIEHGDSHNRAKIFNDCRKAEEPGVVQDSRGNESRVKGREGVAIVCEGLVVEGWHREAFLLVAGHDEREEKLDDDQTRVDNKCLGSGERVLRTTNSG